MAKRRKGFGTKAAKATQRSFRGYMNRRNKAIAEGADIS